MVRTARGDDYVERRDEVREEHRSREPEPTAVEALELGRQVDRGRSVRLEQHLEGLDAGGGRRHDRGEPPDPHARTSWKNSCRNSGCCS
jgi:hypothetical protein